jgi:hypothetical protein
MMSDRSPDTTDPATRAADERDAERHGGADRPPTDDEVAAAERSADSLTDDVREHYEEMAEMGAEIKGEGQIDT